MRLVTHALCSTSRFNSGTPVASNFKVEVLVQSSYYTQVHEGMEVLDTDGQKIGMCGETPGDYFNVDAGFLGTKEYYVPFNAITNITDGSIFLNVRKDDIDTMGWDRRPEMTGTATTGDSQRTVQLREEEIQAR